MKPLSELREAAKRHLKKAHDVLAIADLLRMITADASAEKIVSEALAKEADDLANELRYNSEQSKVFVHDIEILLPTTEESAIQTMGDRFDQLLKQQGETLFRYNSMLDNYETFKGGFA